jgi:hypothetical protein
MQISRRDVKRLARGAAAGVAFMLAAAGAAGAQSTASPWVISAPDAALAWYAVLADLRLAGDGAFPFTRATPDAPATTTAAPSSTLSTVRGHEVLHFVPLYHPSADRVGLAAALRAAADSASADAPSSAAAAVSPRATLLLGALTQSLAPRDRRAHLPALAAALAARRVAAPAPEKLAALQRALDSLVAPALAPWLALERLDRGRLLVVPAIGPEGRLFAGTQDRADNLVAVGSFDGDADPRAPLHAFVREICFPAVSRATSAARGFAVGDPAASRRASLAAVRCGAALLDARAPSQAEAYRAFWLRQSAGAGVDAGSSAGARPAAGESMRAAFDRAFPADAALSAALDRAIARVKEAR